MRAITDRKQAEQEKDRILRDLNERVKELNCLYGIDEIMRRETATVEEAFEEIVHLIPSSWQYPDITGNRIVLEDKVYETSNFKETEWMQKADITVGGTKAGVVEVCYLDKKPNEDEGPFLEEERNVITSIAKRLGEFVEDKKAEEKLHHQASLLENVSDAIISTDLDFTVKTWNKAAETVYGWKADEVIGKSMYEIFPAAYSDSRWEKIEKEFFEKGHWKGEVIQHRKDGSPLNIFASVSLIRDSSKNPVGAVAVNRDITEQKRAEEALQASEEKYRELVENINDVIYATDEKGVITYVSPAVESFMGYTPSEVTGHHFREFIHQKDLPRLREGFQKVLSGHTAANEYRVLARSGELRWMRTSSRPVFVGNRVVGVQGVLADITEHKNAEEALKKSEHKYRQLIEGLHEGIWVIDENACTTFVNDRMAEMLGYTVEEMVGRHLFSFMDKRGVTMCRRYLERCRQGITEQHELEFLRKDGTRLYATIETSPITDDDGTYRGAITGIMDITKRKQAEERLRESEEMYRTLIQTSPDAVTVTDLEGRITHISQRTRELHGFEHADELLGKSAFEFIAPEDHEKAMINLEETLKEGFVRNVEYTMLKRDGTTFIGEINAALIKDAEGNPRAFIATTRDITEKKRAEEQIKASIKEKEVLLREIHHRVKNNMQVISSLLNLQSAHIKEKRYKEVLKEVQDRIRSMTLVHEKLYQSENLANVDSSEYITSIVRGLYRSYEITADRVTLVIEVEDVLLGVDAAVPCGLIINELVSNSLKHAFPKEKGEIRITLCSIDGMIELTVADNGVGIPEYIDFRNTESLGLDLVTTLVEHQLGGEITLDRSRGTAFHIVFQEVKQW